MKKKQITLKHLAKCPGHLTKYPGHLAKYPGHFARNLLNFHSELSSGKIIVSFLLGLLLETTHLHT